MKNPKRSGAKKIPHDKKMRRVLARRLRRGQSDVITTFPSN
jgi:hypothetical protein